ncbi:MAG: pimelyl-ACP methyl ester esterase BioV [Sulfurimonas sp.]|uniref:pimelyl-ACP methyl ester esterase BioV n=1 Tax=Sulfurimonas sp. TaxID=2022749 RepID=UPI002636B111|nr:pimelyl-ACP methyl ester esterase BioV [Sulfurimonas sp.]MDD2652941.1 pimelyl-ACP methyl ester esterase BioV [Sulfurimonas sp.]MDD3452387.1 pimelyl-ACP methyl ester esterase BioV [Sulfurimonas sp.]
MRFYSGFSLKGDEHFFDAYINRSDYTVCGFSYGAIKAFEYAKEQLVFEKRVDTLQLFSPAFFQTKEEKFKKLQLLGYRKSRDLYLIEFIKSCFLPYQRKSVEHKENSVEELEELLYFNWNIDELKNLAQKGVKIEVYLGGKDAVIDAEGAREFFLEVATVTYMKDANHFLQIN